jgi:hypothetical protein
MHREDALRVKGTFALPDSAFWLDSVKHLNRLPRCADLTVQQKVGRSIVVGYEDVACSVS